MISFLTCPSICPTDRRHRRHSATSGDSDNGAERHLATSPDTPRHAGLGLQNRRLQVRFLSHLPLKPEFMGIAASWPPAQYVCVDPYLTPDTTRSNTADL